MPAVYSHCFSSTNRCVAVVCKPYLFTRTQAKCQFLPPRAIFIYSKANVSCILCITWEDGLLRVCEAENSFIIIQRRTAWKLLNAWQKRLESKSVSMISFGTTKRVKQLSANQDQVEVSDESCKLIEEQMRKRKKLLAWNSNSYWRRKVLIHENHQYIDEDRIWVAHPRH